MISASEKVNHTVPVGMGQAILARDPARLTTILGSCVAVTLYAPRRRLGMLCHVVLPEARSDGDNPAKFADTAVPHMISTLKSQGVSVGELTAKIAGGACMFGNSQFARIGDGNVQAVTTALNAAGISIAGRDVNGTAGRHVCFDLATGCVSVSSAGGPARNI